MTSDEVWVWVCVCWRTNQSQEHLSAPCSDTFIIFSDRSNRMMVKVFCTKKTYYNCSSDLTVARPIGGGGGGWVSNFRGMTSVSKNLVRWIYAIFRSWVSRGIPDLSDCCRVSLGSVVLQRCRVCVIILETWQQTTQIRCCCRFVRFYFGRLCCIGLIRFCFFSRSTMHTPGMCYGGLLRQQQPAVIT